VPFGDVTTVENFTKDFSYAVLDIGVGYGEDTDVVSAVLGEIGVEISTDDVYGERIIGPMEIMGVHELGDSAVVIRARVKTKPMLQWGVRREFYRRIKKRFDVLGIEIPFPHQTVYWGEAQPPFRPDIAVPDSVQVARPAPSIQRPPETVRPITSQPTTADKSDDDRPMTPVLREELLAAIAIATSARIGDSDPDIRSRSALIDTADNE
jgi:small conductance mechanosensitive channel